MRHIVVMTSTAAFGLMGLFLVDLADMYFLSRLGEVELASAIGYAGSILFFTTSISIGISIAMSANVARAIGARDRAGAERIAGSTYLFALLVTLPLSGLLWVFVPELLSLLGARGQALVFATTYLRIVVPSMAVLALGMSSSGVLRALGDPRRSMMCSLAGAAVNIVLDPILIFGLDMSVSGAAIASVAARVTIFATAAHSVLRVHRLPIRLSWSALQADRRAIAAIAVPAMLTNGATPVANAFVTTTVAGFGDDAVAGWAVIIRIVPVAFGVLFALSGAVGPIIGQNFGARRPDRVRRTLRDALLFSTGFVLVVAVLLHLLQSQLIAAFDAKGDAAMMIGFFCTWTAPFFVFDSALFVANAAFNNLGRAMWSTLANWGRTLLGTLPLVTVGASLYGPVGALAGQVGGGMLAGGLAMASALALTSRLARSTAAPADPLASAIPPPTSEVAPGAARRSGS